MVKKEKRSKEIWIRGYMTPEDIKKKLEDKYDGFEDERLHQIHYLERILKKKHSLSDLTRNSVYELLDSLYANEAKSLRVKYLKSRFSVGRIDSLDSINLNDASYYIHKRGKLAEERGDVDKAETFYSKAGRLNEKARNKGSVFESKLSSIIAIVGIVSGVFFLSPNLTGNVVGNLNESSSNLLGVGLLILGIIAGLFYLKKSEKNNKTRTKIKRARKKR